MIPTEKLLGRGFFTAEGERVSGDELTSDDVFHSTAIDDAALAVEEPHEVASVVASPTIPPDEVREFGDVVVLMGEPQRAVRAVPRRWNVAPYIGVTGFVSVGEVHKHPLGLGRAVLHHLPHRLMGGVLVSAKTLRGEATESRRYPTADVARVVLHHLGDDGWWPTLHYNSRATGEALDEELARAVDMIPPFGGMQLNLRNLVPAAVERLRFRRPDVEFIVQVRPEDVADRHLVGGYFAHARRFADVAQHVLFDVSGGEGRAPDEDTLQGIEDALCLAHYAGEDAPCMGVAGGLDAGAGDIVRRLALVASPRPLSIDAEGRLRVPVSDADAAKKHQDRLDPGRAFDYIAASADALRRAAAATRDSVRRPWPEHLAHAFATHLRVGHRWHGAPTAVRGETRIVQHGVVDGFPFAAVRTDEGLNVTVAAEGVSEGTYCDVGWRAWDLRTVTFKNARDDEAKDIAGRIVDCVDALPGELPEEDPRPDPRKLSA